MIRKKSAVLIASKSFGLSLFSVLLAVSFLFGCSKGGPGKDISSSAFDSAPAEVKQSWGDGVAA
jgi:hypothetical protein